ncbi:Cupin 2, conserved barrel domain protein [Metallosphaera sedula]|uniref:Cupin 2, conserved barrel domain protein n=3 Tax=Metallosphaera TaxID=41980 RepID=A4YI82_METS5|nr:MULTISPECIES: cupin domain-containing protein [Metallosphaera]ABP96134.1 Cupin 2, conserved barrel domain protein [Metallosphaera sedula DSM 5348]AIM28117.1 Cupin 2, conserved barrel domain protein [Metallosphaera sedula]AKV74942.1 cupin [Metallosphaera sedula]AKV77180.1 cupin [Metallosphaera sedula]AKV79430.1 cupin [Metallosphaera sedula]
MSKLLVRKDLQSELKRDVSDIVKEIEGDDLKVVVFMENTEPAPKVKPKVIRFGPTLTLLEKLAERGQVEPGVAKVMFFSPSTGRSRGLTPNMMAGFQYIKPGVSTKPHSHNMASIYLVVRGRGYSEIDGEIFHWNEGDVFVVPANAVHSHTNTGETEAILFDVTDSGLLENMGILEFKEKE